MCMPLQIWIKTHKAEYMLRYFKKIDLNRPLNQTNEPAILEFREAIFSILNHLKILDNNDRLIKPYLHLALHGMSSIHKDIGPFL